MESFGAGQTNRLRRHISVPGGFGASTRRIVCRKNLGAVIMQEKIQFARARRARENRRTFAAAGTVAVKAFTLVELLVVIGIIGILVGILLPSLSRARDSANLLACQSNMRQVGSGLLGYATDHRGSLPYMLYYPGGDPLTGLPPGGLSSAGTRVVWWASLVQERMIKNGTGGESRDSQPWPWKWSEAWRCTVSEPAVHTWDVSYMANPIAMPNPVFEANPTGSTSNARNPRHVYGFSTGVSSSAAYPNTASNPLRPATLTQLYPDNVLLWETTMDNNPPTFTPWFPWLFNVNWGVSGIDEGRLLNPSATSLRFRSKGRPDPFQNFPNRAMHSSIAMPTRASIITPGAPVPDINGDSYLGLITPYMIGGARFRHRKDTICNVFFADGSIRGLVLTNKVEYVSVLGYESRASDFKRYMLMPKFPTNRTR
jgi:prepilin-type N-terminal cleavage/methylation domain-containing protein